MKCWVKTNRKQEVLICVSFPLSFILKIFFLFLYYKMVFHKESCNLWHPARGRKKFPYKIPVCIAILSLPLHLSHYTDLRTWMSTTKRLLPSAFTTYTNNVYVCMCVTHKWCIFREYSLLILEDGHLQYLRSKYVCCAIRSTETSELPLRPRVN
jgi:hypothetical protein